MCIKRNNAESLSTHNETCHCHTEGVSTMHIANTIHRISCWEPSILKLQMQNYVNTQNEMYQYQYHIEFILIQTELKHQ